MSSEQAEANRLHATMMKNYETDIRLSNDILRSFVDLKAGGPIAYILGCAASEAADAYLGLATVDPAEAKTILQLQSDIARNRDIVRWISKAIVEGKEAWTLKSFAEREDIQSSIIDSIGDDSQ